MPPAPKTPPAPAAGSPLRPVALVVFVRPVDVPGYKAKVKQLIADKPVEIPYDDAPAKAPPPMYRDGDSMELIVGSRRYPIHGGVVESYELAKMAKGKAPE
jgi:hypothetical protein